MKTIRHPPQDREANRTEPIRSLEAVMASLKQAKVRKDAFGGSGDAYEVETDIKLSDREWCFTSRATHNGVDIADDIVLIRETLCRKRVAQAGKTKALWNLFVKEAAKVHLDKCGAVADRLESTAKRQRRISTRLIAGGAVVICACIGLSLYYLTKPPVLPAPFSPVLSEPPPPLTPVALTVDDRHPSPPSATGALPAEPPQPAPSPSTAGPSPEAPRPAPPVAAAEASPDPVRPPDPPATAAVPQPAPPPTPVAPPQAASDLPPEEIRARVNRLLKERPGSP